MPERRSFKRLERRLIEGPPPTTTGVTSERMARVRRSSTAPELRVRRVATALGLRYRTSNRDLPGSPDLANRTKKWAAFVHGCFWHQHSGCSAATVPKSNRAFWQAKFAANLERDERAKAALESEGFSVVIVWECQTRDTSAIREVVGAVRSK